MTPIEKNVVSDSEIYFYKASERAQELFFDPLCIGRYHCDAGYRVIRDCYDSFLVIYVEEGEGYIRTQEEAVGLRCGEFALLDCYRAHEYGTDSGWKILWMHFDCMMGSCYFLV